MSETESEFDRGHTAGGIAERLDSHDRHFTAINGSLEKIAANLGLQTLALQRLADQNVSRDATVITTAAALKDAEEARRDKSTQSWTPVSKALALLGAAVTVAGLIITIVLAAK
jgi:hypothetical protein